MVGEDEIHSTAVDVEKVAQIFASHGCTLAVPTGKSLAPRTGPAHNVFGLGVLPEGEIGLIAFLTHTVELSGGVDHVVEIAAREDAVAMFSVVGLNVEVDGSVAFVGESIGQNPLHQFFLLNDMARGLRFDAGGKHAQELYSGVVCVGIMLGNLHGFELFEPGFLGDFVVSLVGIVFQMAHVGDVSHVAHFVAEVLQIAKHDVEGDGGASVPQVWVAVDGGPADVHANVGGVKGFESFFLSTQSVVDEERIVLRVEGFAHLFLFRLNFIFRFPKVGKLVFSPFRAFPRLGISVCFIFEYSQCWESLFLSFSRSPKVGKLIFWVVALSQGWEA